MHLRAAPIRTLRAILFAAVTVTASMLLHLWAGGGTPHLGAASAAIGAVFLGAYALGGAQRGPAVLIPLCLAVQWFLHNWFTATAPEAHTHTTGIAMWLVHLAAALAQAAWLSRGEAALAALLDLITLCFASVLRSWRAPAPVRTRPRTLRSRVRAPLRGRLLADAISHRGPPVHSH